MLRTVEMAAADARERGLDVEVKAVDDRENEEGAVTAAAELVSDSSVIAVVGHKNSGPSKAAAPVYADAGLAQVTQCSTDNSLSRSGWRTFFRMCATNERQAEVAAALANARLPGASSVAVHDGTAYGRPLVEAFARRLESLSGKPVRVLAMRVGQEDFSEIVDEIKTAGAGIVDLGATEIESSKLMKAIRAAGLPSYVVECYDAVTVIASALEHGASNRAQVRDAIAATDIEGYGGRIRFEANGDRVEAPVSLWTIQAGAMVPLTEYSVPLG